jgi:hypothetical protein
VTVITVTTAIVTAVIAVPTIITAVIAVIMLFVRHRWRCRKSSHSGGCQDQCTDAFLQICHFRYSMFFFRFGPRAANRRFVLLTIGLWTRAIAPKLNAIVIVRSSLGAKQ